MLTTFSTDNPNNSINKGSSFSINSSGTNGYQYANKQTNNIRNNNKGKQTWEFGTLSHTIHNIT